MIPFSSATRVFVALAPIDCRKSFSGLQGCVQEQLHQDPLSGHVFLFTNRTRTRLKLLYWDASGFWVCGKRLEKGRFSWPKGEGVCGQLRPEELHALIHGMEIVARKEWYRT